MKQDNPRKTAKLTEVKAELDRVQYGTRYFTALRSTIYTLVVAAAVAILVATLWMPVLQIYGSSMSPALQEDEIVVSIKTDDFAPGDLVAFYLGNKLLIKRCIAGPGDWVDIDAEGNVYINEVYLDEPYLEVKALGDCDIDLPYQVPDQRWFLMGDHRSTSLDSRNSTVGCVAEEQIVGKVIFRVWPLNKFGPLGQEGG